MTLRALMLGLACGAMLTGAPPLARALEPLDVYENWQEDLMRSDRWRGDEDFGGTEVMRQIVSIGKVSFLVMRYRTEGFIGTPSGQAVARNYLRFSDPTAITEIEVKAVIPKLGLRTCGANNAGEATRGALTIALARFNDGSSTGPADRTGDIEGVIFAARNGSSTDPGGVLQVGAAVIRSTSPSGNFNGTVGNLTLGTVNVGHPFTLRMAWDKPNKQFLFSLNGGTSLGIPYAQSDSAEAVSPFAQIFQRHSLANCDTAPSVVDETTLVGQVRTNASGVIP